MIFKQKHNSVFVTHFIQYYTILPLEGPFGDSFSIPKNKLYVMRRAKNLIINMKKILPIILTKNI